MSQEKLAEQCRERRLAVSIGSIKRAEAGKNVLYRTVSSLACFFNVSVGDLIDEVPSSLWEYSAQHYPEITPCLGRIYELSQLRFLHQLSAQSRQSVCVYGEQGVGKTNLMSHFLRGTNEGSLYVCVIKEAQLFEHLIRAILNLSEELDGARIRLKLKKVVKSPIIYFYLLRLVGLPLSRAEAAALEGLTLKRRKEIDILVLMVLIQNLRERKISILVIDGLQNLDASQVDEVQLLIKHTQNLPLLILFGVTCSLHFSSLPFLLQDSYLIPLKSLDYSTIVALADSIPFDSSINCVPDSHKVSAIARSEGNPRILKALLTSQYPIEVVPPELVQMVQRMVMTLNTLETKLLFFLVSIGRTIGVETIEQYLLSCTLTGIQQLNRLVSVGFLFPLSDGYKFQYKIIWEILQNVALSECTSDIECLNQVS